MKNDASALLLLGVFVFFSVLAIKYWRVDRYPANISKTFGHLFSALLTVISVVSLYLLIDYSVEFILPHKIVITWDGKVDTVIAVLALILTFLTSGAIVIANNSVNEIKMIRDETQQKIKTDREESIQEIRNILEAGKYGHIFKKQLLLCFYYQIQLNGVRYDYLNGDEKQHPKLIALGKLSKTFDPFREMLMAENLEVIAQRTEVQAYLNDDAWSYLDDLAKPSSGQPERVIQAAQQLLQQRVRRQRT